MGKASGRRLGPSLDVNSSTHPTQSLNPYDPNATPKPSSVLPASGHTSPTAPRPCPLLAAPPAVLSPRFASPAQAGRWLDPREGSPWAEAALAQSGRGVGFCTASGSVAGAAARMFLEPQVGLWQCGTAG